MAGSASIIARAKQVAAVVDSQKWLQTSFAEILPFAQVQTWVSDQQLPSAARHAAERGGLRLLLG